MQFNYELNNPMYPKGILIKHVGIPIYAGAQLITPHKIVWWWIPTWVVILGLLPIYLWNRAKYRDFGDATR